MFGVEANNGVLKSQFVKDVERVRYIAHRDTLKRIFGTLMILRSSEIQNVQSD